jgi:hypothetical protein
MRRNDELISFEVQSSETLFDSELNEDDHRASQIDAYDQIGPFDGTMSVSQVLPELGTTCPILFTPVDVVRFASSFNLAIRYWDSNYPGAALRQVRTLFYLLL